MEDTMERFIKIADSSIKISEILNSTDETDSVCEHILKWLSNDWKLFKARFKSFSGSKAAQINFFTDFCSEVLKE